VEGRLPLWGGYVAVPLTEGKLRRLLMLISRPPSRSIHGGQAGPVLLEIPKEALEAAEIFFQAPALLG
jgi:hypothetical protein